MLTVQRVRTPEANICTYKPVFLMYKLQKCVLCIGDLIPQMMFVSSSYGLCYRAVQRSDVHAHVLRNAIEKQLMFSKRP